MNYQRFSFFFFFFFLIFLIFKKKLRIVYYFTMVNESTNALYDTTPRGAVQQSFGNILKNLKNRLRLIKDRSAPYTKGRWFGLLFLLIFYIVRVFKLQGYYIVTYGLGIFLLNLFIGYITPIDDMSDDTGPSLPTSNHDDEFKPFEGAL